MNTYKKIILHCPICGNDQFEYPDGVEESEFNDSTVFKCSDCGTAFARSELIELNQDRIDNTIEEVKEDIANEITRLFEK